MKKIIIVLIIFICHCANDNKYVTVSVKNETVNNITEVYVRYKQLSWGDNYIESSPIIPDETREIGTFYIIFDGASSTFFDFKIIDDTSNSVELHNELDLKKLYIYDGTALVPQEDN